MGRIAIGGSLAVPDHPVGAILFAVRGPAERRDPFRLQVADFLHHAGLATLVSSVVLPGEPDIDDVERLANRVAHGLAWMDGHPKLSGLPFGCFAEGEAVAPALIAAAHSDRLQAVVGQGGRPDRAAAALTHVRIPTLLVVGELESGSLASSRGALQRLGGLVELAVIDQTHDTLEEDSLGTVCLLTRRWFLKHLEPMEVH